MNLLFLFLTNEFNELLVQEIKDGANGGCLSVPRSLVQPEELAVNNVEPALNRISSRLGMTIEDPKRIYVNYSGKNYVMVYSASIIGSDKHKFIPVSQLYQYQFIEDIAPAVKLFAPQSGKLGDKLALDINTDFTMLDKSLSQFELIYSEVNRKPRKVKFASEFGLVDVQGMIDVIIDFISDEYPYHIEGIDKLHGCKTLSELFTELSLILDGASDEFILKYMVVNPISNPLRSSEYKCAICGLDPYKKYGVAGLGSLKRHQENDTYTIIPVCPTCEFIANNRVEALPITLLKSFTED